jgi:hypothetical protein
MDNKSHAEIGMFLGVDVGKGAHHAVALDRVGERLLDRPLPNDETELRGSAPRLPLLRRCPIRCRIHSRTGGQDGSRPCSPSPSCTAGSISWWSPSASVVTLLPIAAIGGHLSHPCEGLGYSAASTRVWLGRQHRRTDWTGTSWGRMLGNA